MFDFSGFLSRDDHHDVTGETMSMEANDRAEAAPVDHIVLKDGQPFAILNASPALAEYAIAGFVLATPGSHWTLARC